MKLNLTTFIMRLVLAGSMSAEAQATAESEKTRLDASDLPVADYRYLAHSSDNFG